MAKRRRGVRPRDLQIAQANTNLRYAPEERSLAALVGQAREDYKTDVRVAKGMAATAIRSARQSRKPLRRIYNQALTQADVAQQDVEQAFQQAGAGADVFRAATARESALNRQRVAGAAARAYRETVSQANEARLGKIFAMGAARNRFTDTVRQLQQRQLDLTGEKRMYLMGELGKAQAERAKVRESRRSQRYSRETQLQVAEAQQQGKGGGGFEKASRSESRLFTTAYAKAMRRARDSVEGGDSRSQAMNDLISGVPAVPKGAAGKNSPALPALGAIPDQLAARAAVEMAYNGFISPKTKRKLLDRGIRISDLAGARRPPKTAKARRRRKAAEQGRRTRRAGEQLPVIGGIFGVS